MQFLRTLNNNFRHDIWGNYQMARQLGAITGYGYLAKKSLALAKAMLTHRVITINNRDFYDTWG